jgi:hypothetical protein
VDSKPKLLEPEPRVVATFGIRDGSPNCTEAVLLGPNERERLQKWIAELRGREESVECEKSEGTVQVIELLDGSVVDGGHLIARPNITSGVCRRKVELEKKGDRVVR